MIVVFGEALSSVYVISYEFFEDVGNGGVVDDFVYEGDDINGVVSLSKVYCYKCCTMWWSFLIKAFNDGVKGMFGFESVLVSALWLVWFDDCVYG